MIAGLISALVIGYSLGRWHEAAHFTRKANELYQVWSKRSRPSPRLDLP